MAESNPVLLPDDDVIDDGDSALGDDAASSTQSLSSSIVQYRKENGRTYHAYKDGKYNLPNDDLENERLDLQHHLFFLTYADKLGLAPPNEVDSKVRRVLDLGTGTGIWAMDFADEHPKSVVWLFDAGSKPYRSRQAQVTGVDLSPIQPSFVPPNVRFIIDDIDDEWSYSEPFDYIHSRMMNFSVVDWTSYLRKIHDNLTPGGYVEIQEIDINMTSDDGTLSDNHPLFKWRNLLKDASVKLGRPYASFDVITKAMTEAGFTNLVDARFKWPTNRWPKDKKYKELGMWNNENTNAALEALSLASFTRAFGWGCEEVTVLLADVRKDLNDPKIHAYWPICSIYAKKPEA